MVKSRLDGLTATFFIVTFVSSAFLVAPLRDYLEFYRAITAFSLNVGEVKIDTSLLERLELIITFNLTASNPTGFGGLSVHSISSKLYYQSGVHLVPTAPYTTPRPIIGHPKYVETTWWELKKSQTSSLKNLEPYQNATIPITFLVTPHLQYLATCGTLSRYYALDFLAFFDTCKGNINWRLQCVVYLTSFLGPHTLPFEIYAQSKLD